MGNTHLGNHNNTIQVNGVYKNCGHIVVKVEDKKLKKLYDKSIKKFEEILNKMEDITNPWDLECVVRTNCAFCIETKKAIHKFHDCRVCKIDPSICSVSSRSGYISKIDILCNGEPSQEDLVNYVEKMITILKEARDKCT